MKLNSKILACLFLIAILFISGCATNKNHRDTTKNYRDTRGVLKTETRSTSGVNK